MAHIFIQLPDDLYQHLQTAAWRANMPLAELIIKRLEEASRADLVVDARQRAGIDPRQPATFDSDLTWAYDAAISAGERGNRVRQGYERFSLDWEVDAPLIQTSDDNGQEQP